MQPTENPARQPSVPDAAQPLPQGSLTRDPLLLNPLSPPHPPAQPANEDVSTTRLKLFMGTRLGIATVLLGGTLIIALENQKGFDAFTPRFLVVLIGAIYAASLAFAIGMLRSMPHERLALAQIATDLVVTAGLVYVTGGPSSGFTFLFGVAVLMAAMVVGPGPARITGVLAIFFYCATSAGLATGILNVPADQSPEAYLLPLRELVYVGALNVLGLLLVTVLASNLSGRLLTAGGQLRLAEASAATLARLNDDIVRSLSSGLLSTDLDGRIRTINPMAIEMLGGNADTLLGKPLARMMDVKGSQARAEGVAQRLDGRRFPIGYSVNPLINIEGASIGALVLFQDLSEIARLRGIAARQERLAVLGRLSAGLAHEIRNPLGSISGSVQLVRESPHLSEEERRLLGIIIDEVDRLNDLVSTMLQVGRPREPVFEKLDLRDTVTSVVDMAQPGVAAASGIHIKPILPAQPVTISADGDQVRQILWNLLKNALQASPTGSCVHIEARSLADGGAVLLVRDEGQGIEPSQREKVYELFYSERTHGAGIGLALVRQIVDAHGATIEIKSEQQQGATFAVTFPADGMSVSRRSLGPNTSSG